MVRVLPPLRLILSLALLAALPARAEPVRVAVSEFPEENAALIAATLDFFDRVEATGTERSKPRRPVIGLPLRATKSKLTRPARGLAGAEMLTRMGPVHHLTGYRISWYPVERLLGTVDYMGTWNGNRNLVCGYLTWDLGTPAAPKLVAVEANYVDLDELADQPAVEIHRTLLTANCAFGAIDENFAFFEVTG